jgi:hypothetical protein
LAAVFEIEDDREGQSVVAGCRVRNVRDIQFKHRLGPFDPSSRSKLSRSAQRELDWYEAPWSANALISVLLCASLGRSCRDRGAELLDGLLAVSPARARPASMISMSATPIKPKTWRRYRQMCQDGERDRHSQPDAAGRCRARDQQGQRSQDLDQSGDDPKPLADSDLVEYLPLPD